MKTEWKKCKLGEICQFSSVKIALTNLNRYNYISTENMLSNRAGITVATTLPNTVQTPGYSIGDILISNIRPYLKKIWYANQTGGTSNDILIFKANKNIDSLFLYYILSADKFFDYSNATSTGTKMPRGDKKAIMEYKIFLPPLPVQKKIAGILKSLDDKIELNRQISKNLEEQAQSLYQNMLKNAQIKMGTISDIGTVIGGGTPSKKCSDFYTDNGIAWITPKDLSTTRAKFTSRGADDITELGYKNSSAKLMPKGTILFSSRAPIGYISIAQNQICTNQGFKSVIPNSDIGTAFVYFLLKDKISIIENRASGSTFKEATTTLMNSIECDIPDKMSLEKFNKQCNAIFSMQETLQKENQKLASLRDTLLPKLMSGEIEV